MKELTDKECLDVVRRAVEESEIDDFHAYQHFLEALGGLIADHFGGECAHVGHVGGKWRVGFVWNECVPDNGGVFKDYDPKTSVEDWRQGAEKEA